MSAGDNKSMKITQYVELTLNGPIATKVVCFSRLLKCFRSFYGKQCGPRSDCSYRSSLVWVHAVCFYTKSSVMLGNYLQQMTFSDAFFSWRFTGLKWQSCLKCKAPCSFHVQEIACSYLVHLYFNLKQGNVGAR